MSVTFAYDDFIEKDRPRCNVFLYDKGNKQHKRTHYFETLRYHMDINIKKTGSIEEKYYYPLDVFSSRFFLDERNRDIVLNDIIINDIQNGKCKIILLESVESFRERDNLNDLIDSLFNRYPFLKNRLILSSCNYKLQNLIDRDGVYDLPYNSFEHKLKAFLPNREYVRKNVFTPTKQKLFLNYNRMARFARIIFVHKLQQNDLFNNGLVSLGLLSGGYKNLMNNEFNMDYESFIKELPYTIDGLDLTENRAEDLTHKDYHRTMLSVVNETFIHEENTFFPSEKIFKPIMMMQPFIVCGNQYFLKYLRELGYKTFEPWFNESYDDAEDWELRCDMIIDELKRLNKLTHKQWSEIYFAMIHILEHNYDHYVNRCNSKEFQYKLEEFLGA